MILTCNPVLFITTQAELLLLNSVYVFCLQMRPVFLKDPSWKLQNFDRSCQADRLISDTYERGNLSVFCDFFI